MATPRKTILYIEDDREAAELVAEDLVERGYRVHTSYDGTEGLRLALSLRPDLVLCDINLPGISGFEILERLSAVTPRFGYMPFVFLTAFTDRESQLRGRQLGADDYVTKPVDFALLSAIIENRLARAVTNQLWPLPVALNTREVETLTWAARGKTSSEIAMIMGLSKRTVDFHADNARTKLGATNRIEATIRAASSRMIQP
jgi:DNA-binding NarL/FixJ family response regulator